MHYKDRNFEVVNYRIDATRRSGIPVDANYFLNDVRVDAATAALLAPQ